MGTFKINGELELNSYLTAATNLYVSSASNTSIIFRHGSTEYVRINPSGCLNIGSTQTASTYKLYVAGKTWLSDTLYFNNAASYINASDYTGNAATATKLKTARTISLTGSVTGSGTFDGSGNLSITTTTNHAHSYLPLSGGTMSGPVYMGSTSTTDGPSIVFFSNKRNYIWMGYANDNGSWYIWDKHNSKGIIASDVNGNNTFFGNAATATKLATARTIALTGSVTGSGTFDGSGNLSIATTTNHSHSYLPLSGGTMTGVINKAGSSSSWINGRDKALVRLSSYNAYSAIAAMKTTNGSWDMGVYTNDCMYFTYAPDTKYNAGDNSGYVQVKISPTGILTAPAVYGAVWNDYAEFRSQKEEIKPGYCVASTDNGQVYKTTKKFQACDGIVSDTFGFAIGETDECKTPLAVAGRVLAYCEGDRYSYHSGDTVCAGPDGKIVKMTREEIREWPDRIIGIVSEIPEYETWGTGNIVVNGRIWIKIK